MKCFQARAKGDFAYGTTPRAAALAFFAAHPSRRKCSIIKGTKHEAGFTVVYGRRSAGEWPQSWKDVSKAGAQALPDVPAVQEVAA